MWHVLHNLQMTGRVGRGSTAMLNVMLMIEGFDSCHTFNCGSTMERV